MEIFLQEVIKNFKEPEFGNHSNRRLTVHVFEFHANLWIAAAFSVFTHVVKTYSKTRKITWGLFCARKPDTLMYTHFTSPGSLPTQQLKPMYLTMGKTVSFSAETFHSSNSTVYWWDFGPPQLNTLTTKYLYAHYSTDVLRLAICIHHLEYQGCVLSNKFSVGFRGLTNKNGAPKKMSPHQKKKNKNCACICRPN